MTALVRSLNFLGHTHYDALPFKQYVGGHCAFPRLVGVTFQLL